MMEILYISTPTDKTGCAETEECCCGRGYQFELRGKAGENGAEGRAKKKKTARGNDKNLIEMGCR